MTAPTSRVAAAPTTEEVLVSERGRVLVLTLNRPEARNAVTLRMATLIAGALEQFDQRPDLTVAVITGAGGSFCAGMDLRRFAEGERPVVQPGGFAGFVQQPPQKPIIAAVEGFAVAGGFEIALACDLVVAASDARFALPEVKRGLTAAGGALMRLQHRIPYHLAMELVLTGRTWTAEDAARVHLVNRLTEPGGALQGALTLAAEIGENAPMSVLASKQVLVRSSDWPADELFARQEEWVSRVRESDDAREGARAFVERRAPQWSGV